MSGLLSSAYPWGDSNSQSTKKRTPSLSISRNKTIKRNSNLVKENTIHSDDNYGDFTPFRIEDAQSVKPFSFNSTLSEGVLNEKGFKPLNNTNHHSYIDDAESIASFPHKPDNRLVESKEISSQSSVMPFSDVNDAPYASLQDTYEKNQFRNSRVQEIINNMNKINVDDTGNGLASFAPLPLFSEAKPNPPIGSVATYPTSNSESHLGNSYYHAYSDKSKIGNIPYYSLDRVSQGGGRGEHARKDPTHDGIMEKLNKMLYLLEEQQHEPTKHIMEEFILYTFLGVFIIFIVDSFSKSGKYIR
jgi:hypothetical protein